ncbi:adenosine deaminase [Ilumatobacter sp.]|uniref:adenosine deaminase n=1 Tax=Ilumatobacter sp. TaxID=1967498 RepID=UPI003AF5A08A
MADAREEFIRSLPKAELHVHIEGTLEPEMMFELAARNGVDLPYGDVAEVRAAYSFDDLQSFLDIYYEGASVLQLTQDFDDLMSAYLQRAHADGVRRAEIFFDPQTHTERGIGFDVFMAGFLAAIERAQRELGISAALIMCFLRHLPVDAAADTLELALPHREHLLGVGLDSSEVGHPPEPYAPVFRRAAELGLRRVAHAGEEGPPAYVAGALDALGAERIDHGVRAESDDALIARLADSSIPLTVCPLSNLALGGVERLEEHNLKRLMDRGVMVTVNSDDPAYFGGYLLDNYVRTARALDLTSDDLATLARNSIEASFATDDERARWLAELDAISA